MKILIFVNSKQNFKFSDKLGGIEILNYNLFNYLKKKYKLTIANSINNKIKKTEWDIIISSNDARIFNILKAKRKILWLHNKLQVEKAFRKKQLFSLLFNKMEAVFVSSYLNKKTSGLYNFKRRLVIPNFLPEIFQRYNFRSKKIFSNIKFVWSVQRERGLSRLIDIWIKKIHPLNLHSELHVFAIKKNNQKKLKKFNIFFHGRVGRKQLIKFYKKSNGMICLGYDETFCLNAIEGMKMGLPVVSLGKTALNELIINNKNGYIANNLNEIDKPIIKFLKLTNKKKKKIIKSTLMFASKYDSNKILQKWDNYLTNKYTND